MWQCVRFASRWDSNGKPSTSAFSEILVLASTMSIMDMVASDGRMREVVSLPLDMLNGWLFGIDANRVKPELKEMVLRYQRECYRVLADYWTGNDRQNSSITQQLAISRHRLALLKELHRTRDSAMREAIHQQLDHVSRLLNLPTPEFDSIGWSAPAMPEALARFWDALASLDVKGVEYNHHRTPGLLAINLRGLARLLVEHDQPMLFDRALREALTQSQEPRCLYTNHSVNSQLVGKSVRCWVFERIQPQGRKQKPGAGPGFRDVTAVHVMFSMGADHASLLASATTASSSARRCSRIFRRFFSSAASCISRRSSSPNSRQSASRDLLARISKRFLNLLRVAPSPHWSFTGEQPVQADSSLLRRYYANCVRNGVTRAPVAKR